MQFIMNDINILINYVNGQIEDIDGKLITLDSQIRCQIYKTLVDTGANSNYMSDKTLERIIKSKESDDEIQIQTYNEKATRCF